MDRLLHAKPTSSARAPEPVRKPSMNLSGLAPGSVLRFSSSSVLPEFAGRSAEVHAVRTYCFGTDVTISYQLALGTEVYYLTIAEDAQGYYLAIARALSEAEQDQFFGRDALGFFTEQSTARTIRCKADLALHGRWLGARYNKVVDWTVGSITLGRLSTAGSGKQTRQFHYNQLVDESGEKALEIEHYEDGTKENRVFITVYRPASDIASIAEPVPHIPAPGLSTKPVASKNAPLAEIKKELKAINGHAMNGHAVNGDVPSALAIEQAVEKMVQEVVEKEVQLFATPAPKPQAQPQPRTTDFRRMSEEEPEEIHIGRAPQTDKAPSLPAEIPPLPSFLLSRENSYMSLDEIITPETEQIRCDLISTKLLIDTAIKRRVHVKDILRELLGLDSGMKDEAVFELPLSESDYRSLAMRYRLKPDRRADIRLCLQEELRLKLLAIAKN